MSQDIDKIKLKIKKLLALATSDNPHEATAAMRQAMKMMARHNLTEDDVAEDAMINTTYESDYVKIPKFMRTLYHGISQAFGVYSVRQNGYTIGDIRKGAKIFLSGRKEDVRRT